MKLYKVFVKEKQNPNSELNAFASPTNDEIAFKVHESLEKKESFYLMHEYTRKEGILRIGVQEEKAASVIVQMDQSTIQLTRSVQEPSFWYDSKQSWKDGWFLKQKESYFGMNASGEAIVRSFDSEGQLIDMKKVLVMPSTFSYEHYQMMKMEVKSYLENISASTASADKSEKVKGVQIPLYPLKKIERFICSLENGLNRICENPAERLLQRKKKISQTQVKKWDGHLLIERALKGSYQKLSIRSMEKDSNLPEHQMIKDFLLSVQNRIFQEKTVEEALLNQLQNELNSREEKLHHQVIGKEQELMIHLQKRVQSIKESINVMRERVEKWEGFEEKVEKLLMESLFSYESMPLQYTHLFGHDPAYQRVFQLYEEWENLVPKLEQMERDFINGVLNSPNLYQIWVLIQLVYEFERYQYRAIGDVWSSMVDCYTEKGELIDWTCIFESEDGGKIMLGYEREVTSSTGTMLRPDYLIAYQSKQSTTWDLHILDAKYKPYSLMKNGQALLKNDVKRSAERYLRMLQLNKVKANRTAALIHIDPTIVHWNLEGYKTYEVSHFHLLPGNLENLKTYMKRLFHYFNEQIDCCPTCGLQTPPLFPGSWKKTYVCPSDDEVWVSSTCNHCGQLSKINLMKYTSENYNEQVKSQWNVHCPSCSKEYKGAKIELDYFGHTI